MYRDDGMAGVQGGKQDVERCKKKLYSIFQELDLKITVEGGSKTMDFLDVIFNLDDGSYCPFVKPNTTTNYVSCESSHPESILKTIPIGVAKRLSTNSSSKEAFDNHSQHFQDAMKAAGYNTPLSYIEDEKKTSRNRKRNVMYFNPPWSSNVSTNIGGLFLKLVRKHFSKGSPLYHLFNTKKLKVSYSTTQNMGKIIAGHNSKVLRMLEQTAVEEPISCECDRNMEECPFGGECLKSSLVYKADVIADGNLKSYIGQTQNTFKERLQGHNSNIRLGKKCTTLSTYITDLKKKGVVPDSITWSKVQQVMPRRKGDKICRLCNTEKTHIAIGDPSILLNKRNELMNRCRHKDSLVLTNDLSTVKPPSVVAARRDLVYPSQHQAPANIAINNIDPFPASGSDDVVQTEDEIPLLAAPPWPDRRSRRKEVDYRKFF